MGLVLEMQQIIKHDSDSTSLANLPEVRNISFTLLMEEIMHQYVKFPIQGFIAARVVSRMSSINTRSLGHWFSHNVDESSP